MLILNLMISWAMAVTCSLGSERYTHLVNLFHKPSLTDEDSFLRAYRTQKQLKSLPGIKHLLPSDEFNPQCLKISMKRIPHITAKRKVCQTSQEIGQTIRIRGLTPPSKFSSGDQIVSEELCMEDEMLDYISWGYTQAINCINALPSYKNNGVYLNPVTIFEIFNLESAYGFYLYSTRGLGIGQLTTSGVGDFLPNQRFSHIVKEVSESTSMYCMPFKEIAQKPILLGKSGGDTVIRHCQFLSITEGVGRNLLYSSLHLAAKEWEVMALLKRYKQTEVSRRIIDQLLFIAYSRHGLDGVESILKHRPQLKTMTAQQFYQTYHRSFPYLREVRDKTIEFLADFNQTVGDNATYADFENGLCKN